MGNICIFMHMHCVCKKMHVRFVFFACAYLLHAACLLNINRLIDLIGTFVGDVFVIVANEKSHPRKSGLLLAFRLWFFRLHGCLSIARLLALLVASVYQNGSFLI